MLAEMITAARLRNMIDLRRKCCLCRRFIRLPRPSFEKQLRCPSKYFLAIMDPVIIGMLFRTVYESHDSGQSLTPKEFSPSVLGQSALYATKRFLPTLLHCKSLSTLRRPQHPILRRSSGASMR